MNNLQFVDSGREYNDIHETFVRDVREQEKVWLENSLVPKLRKVFTQDGSATDPEFKVLAVGSGVGSLDCLFLRALFSHGEELLKGKLVTWTVVEPNAAAIDEFKHRISLQDAAFPTVKFDFVNKGVQEFLEGDKPELYDMIHFLHVLYYVENEETVLKSAYERYLASPGCIVAAVGSEGDIWVNLIEKFKSRIPSLSSELHCPTNIELSEICKRNGWAFETFNGKLDLETTDIFNDRNPRGEAMLKFFLHISESPKEKYGEDLMSELVDFFRGMSWEKVKNGKKCLFVSDDEGVLLIYKRA